MYNAIYIIALFRLRRNMSFISAIIDVIHTVGPIYRDKEKLMACYRKSLQLLESNKLSTIVRIHTLSSSFARCQALVIGLDK